MKSLTIKPNATEDQEVFLKNIEKFHAERAKNQLSPAAFFNSLLSSEKTSDSNPDEVKHLKHLLSELQDLNNSLLEENNKLKQDQLTSDSFNKNQVESLLNEIESLKSQSTNKVEVNYPDFVCSLPEETAEHIRKVRSWFYKAGFTKNQDTSKYPNEFVKYATRYLLINEFKKHIS